MRRQVELVSMTTRETTRIRGQERQLKFDSFSLTVQTVTDLDTFH